MPLVSFLPFFVFFFCRAGLLQSSQEFQLLLQTKYAAKVVMMATIFPLKVWTYFI